MWRLTLMFSVGAEGLEPPTFALEGRNESAGQEVEAPDRCTPEYPSVPLGTSALLRKVLRNPRSHHDP